MGRTTDTRMCNFSVFSTEISFTRHWIELIFASNRWGINDSACNTHNNRSNLVWGPDLRLIPISFVCNPQAPWFTVLLWKFQPKSCFLKRTSSQHSSYIKFVIVCVDLLLFLTNHKLSTVLRLKPYYYSIYTITLVCIFIISNCNLPFKPSQTVEWIE